MDNLAAGWIATPQEIMHSAQVFAWVHLPLLIVWVQKHWFTGKRHDIIRKHHTDGHKGLSPFKCHTADCATL